MVKLTDNQKIYRGCVIGMIEVICDGICSLEYDLESCEGMAYDFEIEQLKDSYKLMKRIQKKLLDELKPYNLQMND